MFHPLVDSLMAEVQSLKVQIQGKQAEKQSKRRVCSHFQVQSASGNAGTDVKKLKEADIQFVYDN
eukprot:scaffold15763_cov25-Prasinocladus_malaysianus.AAC.1